MKSAWPTVEDAQSRVRDCVCFTDISKCISLEYAIINHTSKYNMRLGILTVAEYIKRYNGIMIFDDSYTSFIKSITKKLKSFPNFSEYMHDFIKLTDPYKHQSKQLYITSLLSETVLGSDIANYISTMY